jgi:hypothetical protein
MLVQGWPRRQRGRRSRSGKTSSQRRIELAGPAPMSTSVPGSFLVRYARAEPDDMANDIGFGRGVRIPARDSDPCRTKWVAAKMSQVAHHAVEKRMRRQFAQSMLWQRNDPPSGSSSECASGRRCCRWHGATSRRGCRRRRRRRGARPRGGGGG